jgi:hypothetical protein
VLPRRPPTAHAAAPPANHHARRRANHHANLDARHLADLQAVVTPPPPTAMPDAIWATPPCRHITHASTTTANCHGRPASALHAADPTLPDAVWSVSTPSHRTPSLCTQLDPILLLQLT